jgi:hypothetical protein
MRKWIALVLVLLGLGLIFAFVVPYGFIHFFGIDTQQSDNYDFFSGPGPVFVTLIGFSSLFAGLVSHVNCHEPGCWRVGRHKVNGTPWCNTHHVNVRPERTEHEILSSIEASLGDLVTLLRAQAGEPQ